MHHPCRRIGSLTTPLIVSVVGALGTTHLAQADPVLSHGAAVRLALERNPEVETARQAWLAARGRLTAAGAIPAPEVELELEQLPGIVDYGDFAERNVGIVQRFESPWKWWHRRRAAARDAEAARQGVYEMVRLQVTTRTRIAYDRVLLDERAVVYADQDLALSQAFLDKAQRRLEAGDVGSLEVLRARVQAGRSATRLSQVRAELAKSRRDLNALLARDLETPFAVTGGPEDAAAEDPLFKQELSALVDRALRQRPDLRGADLEAQAAAVRSALARATYVPDLRLGVFRQTLKEGANRQDLWRVSFGFELPLWGARQPRGAAAEARAEAARTQARGRTVRWRVRLEVETAYLDARTAGEQVVLFGQQVLPEAERAHEAARQSHGAGKASYLELLEAQRALTASRFDATQAQFDLAVARHRLQLAVGAGAPE